MPTQASWIACPRRRQASSSRALSPPPTHAASPPRWPHRCARGRRCSHLVRGGDGAGCEYVSLYSRDIWRLHRHALPRLAQRGQRSRLLRGSRLRRLLQAACRIHISSTTGQPPSPAARSRRRSAGTEHRNCVRPFTVTSAPQRPPLRLTRLLMSSSLRAAARSSLASAMLTTASQTHTRAASGNRARPRPRAPAVRPPAALARPPCAHPARSSPAPVRLRRYATWRNAAPVYTLNANILHTTTCVQHSTIVID